MRGLAVQAKRSKKTEEKVGDTPNAELCPAKAVHTQTNTDPHV